MPELLRDLQAAIANCRSGNTRAKPSRSRRNYSASRKVGARGPQLLGDILPLVLARLGVGAVQSRESGE